MRFILFVACFTSLSAVAVAQSGTAEADPNKVCIYVDNVPGRNAWLTDAQRERLRAKLVLAASRSNAVQVGLSSFLLYPQVDLADVTVNESTMKPITVAKLQVVLGIARLDKLDAPLGEPGTVFDSGELTLVGTGADTATAVNDAIGQIQASDQRIANLLKHARERIMAYYVEHCADVEAEAARAYELQNYAMSIALLYSIPEGTSCYENARSLSVEAYRQYQRTECQKRLLRFKASSVIQQGPDVNPVIKQQQYAEVLKLVREMDPTAEGCYEEAYNMLNALAKDFDATNKMNWDKTSKLVTEAASVDREMYKAMAEMNSKQQPGPFNILVGK